MAETLSREHLLSIVETELAKVYEKHGRARWGRHEFIGILTEEFEELKECVFRNHDSSHLIEELAQVILVCMRYAEIGNRYGSEL